jgi:putative peptidoglycan lipid II flippase
MNLLGLLRSLRNSSLVRATLAVASLGLLVKVFALVKDMVVAARFGVGREMDIFTLAFSISAFPITLLAGNMQEAFIPVYVGLRSVGRFEEAWGLHFAVRKIMLGGLLAVGLLMAATARLWVPHAVPTWSLPDQARLRWLLTLVLVTLPQGGVTMLIAATLNGQRRFGPSAMSPALTSLAILGVMLLPLGWGAFQLGTGLVLGGVLEMTFLIWVLHRLDTGHGEGRAEVPMESVRTVGRLYIPAIGAGFFMSSTAIVDMLITSRLPAGGIATLAYSSKIPGVLVALASGALGTTVFPAFSHMAGLGEWRGLRSRATRVFVMTMAACVLMTLVLWMLSPWLVNILFRRGSFGRAQVAWVAPVQSIYFLQLPLFIPSMLSVRFIQALRQHRVIFYGTILSAVLNLVLDLLFLPILGVRGIALSKVCVSLVTLCFLTTWAHFLLKQREAGMNPA